MLVTAVALVIGHSILKSVDVDSDDGYFDLLILTTSYVLSHVEMNNTIKATCYL